MLQAFVIKLIGYCAGVVKHLCSDWSSVRKGYAQSVKNTLGYYSVTHHTGLETVFNKKQEEGELKEEGRGREDADS